MTDETFAIERYLCSSESGLGLLDSLIQANISLQSLSMSEARRMLTEREAEDQRLRLKFAMV